VENLTVFTFFVFISFLLFASIFCSFHSVFGSAQQTKLAMHQFLKHT